ncbi:MAG TPA: metallophosphoesterase [Vicinamibacteria bacterium]|nr:metallophosphoesterase [Vicinamibacteria bacterium]
MKSPALRPRRSPLLGAGLILALTSPGLVSRAEAGSDPCRVPDAPRVVAVGDVHGAYDNFVSILRFTGILDAQNRWAGGKAHLVQTGDLMDRGKDTRKVLDLVMGLEGEARKAGGEVHALLGNHEVMNMIGDLRYVNAEEYESFRTPQSLDRRWRFLHTATQRARERAKEAGEPFDEEAYRSKLADQVPPGFVERTQALSAEGTYGRWLRQRPVLAKVNGVVFVHGGLTPEVAALGCEELNARVKREVNEDLEKTRQDSRSSLAGGPNGPLWYRGLAQDDESLLAPRVDEVLRSLAARAIVVGHTVTGTSRIQSRFGGRVIGIDVGMSDVYGGHLAALEVAPDGTMTAVYPEKREELSRPAAAARTGPEAGPRPSAVTAP